MLVFDWDDTLCPSSWIARSGLSYLEPPADAGSPLGPTVPRRDGSV